MIATASPLCSTLVSRSSNYRLFARLFFKPLAEEDLETLVAADFEALSLSFDEGSLLREGFNNMGRDLRRFNTGTRQRLATDYTMCFDGISSYNDLVAVPYASVFLSEDGLLYQEPRNEVYHLFNRESLQIKSNLDLAEDHISFELDFLAVLSERATEALDSGEITEAKRCLELSQVFIENSILIWYDMLADRASHLLKTRFYQGLLKATKGYLMLDQIVIQDMIQALEVL